jgi:hypothetical protein
VESYLHNDTEQFRAAVLATSAALGITPAYTVKDYFICLLLNELTEQNPDLVFKGGTCLSKCHHAINRFSEDIDLGLAAERVTESMHKRVKSAVVNAAESTGLTIQNFNQIRSRRDFNKYLIGIPDFGFEGIHTLIVETATITPAYPTIEKSVSSFIYDWAISQEIDEGTLDYKGLKPFTLKASSIERTFADKLFAICDYYLDDLPIPPRQSRHIYDLYKLQKFITFDDSMRTFLEIVRKQRIHAPRCHSAQDGVNLSSILEQIIKEDAYRKDYITITSDLLYENVTYEEAVSILHTISQWLKE